MLFDIISLFHVVFLFFRCPLKRKSKRIETITSWSGCIRLMKFILTILISVCAPGHYRHAVSDTFSWCERCPYDHYQDETNQQTCKPCPSGTKLQALGATSGNQCIATGVIYFLCVNVPRYSKTV